MPTPNAPWVEIMAHNNDIRNPLFANAMVEWERRCGRLEGGQFAPGRNARRGIGEFAAGASDQISLIKWVKVIEPTGSEVTGIVPYTS